MTRRSFARAAAAAGFALGLLGAAGAGAQEAAPEGGPQATVVEQHGLWVFECATYGSAEAEYCTMQQVLTVNDTDDIALAVTIAYNPQSGEPIMLAMTPLGVDLAVGMGIKIDDGPQLGVPYTICQRIGCRAAAPLTAPMLGSLKAGNTMSVSYSYRGQRVDVPVSLDGFTAAHAALEAKQPERTAAPAASGDTVPSLTTPPASDPQLRLTPSE